MLLAGSLGAAPLVVELKRTAGEVTDFLADKAVGRGPVLSLPFQRGETRPGSSSKMCTR